MDETSKVEELAKQCHETERARMHAEGDHSWQLWEHAPEHQKQTARAFVKTVLEATGHNAKQATPPPPPPESPPEPTPAEQARQYAKAKHQKP